jgi:hypothetical protein
MKYWHRFLCWLGRHDPKFTILSVKGYGESTYTCARCDKNLRK